MLEQLLTVLLSLAVLVCVYVWDVSRGEAWASMAGKLMEAYAELPPPERRRREEELAAGCPEELF